jgi:hypothetical protein
MVAVQNRRVAVNQESSSSSHLEGLDVISVLEVAAIHARVI